MKDRKQTKVHTGRYTALAYDIPMLAISAFIFLYLSPSEEFRPRLIFILLQTVLCAVCVFSARGIAGVYRQILRYGGSRMYIRLITADLCAGIVYYLIQLLLPPTSIRVTFIRAVCIITFNLLEAVASRLLYQYVFEYGSRRLWTLPGFRSLVKFFTGLYLEDPEVRQDWKKILPEDAAQKPDRVPAPARAYRERKRLAIVGAGRIGAMLAKELMTNQNSAYVPACFVDSDVRKSGREIYGIPVLEENDGILEKLQELHVEEIVFALPRMHAEQKHELYERYRRSGCRILIYDYPLSQSSEFGKRTLREFRIEELLFRDAREFMNDDVRAFYVGKTILVTGGGGSIGSELCRQIARMSPRKLIVLDVYENSAYDLQQELIMTYGRGVLPFEVEICSITDRRKLESVFASYRPEIVLHAAAHKHVPLMEHNVTEAVENNVFGTRNMIELAIRYQVEKFLMVSTDKAVNPTNVMGATKRMCEMMVMSAAARGTGTKFCATRFGNVLASNGSVVPLFKKQIAAGGPVTVTDKRIIRYFMTIPEATQLVLTCCALSENGELFALDMGKPMSILSMAENMIRLSGLEPYRDIDIVEIGLRPGEKLYEELLIDFDRLQKTQNDMIYVEHDAPLPDGEIEEKLRTLQEACDTLNSQCVYHALQQTVPTFHTPEEVNRTAFSSREFESSGLKTDENTENG